ncbi:MAG: hypothetical protein IPM59_12260 [Chloracidobacterium sp.]|nr:hypothetical protein [Chloracidobacterium sp.]
MKKVIALSAVLVMGALGMACGEAANTNTAVNKAANAANAAANAMNAAANTMANAANTMANAANKAADAANKATDSVKPSNAAPANNAAAKPANK